MKSPLNGWGRLPVLFALFFLKSGWSFAAETPADRILVTEPEAIREVLVEVLERHPDIERARVQAVMLEERAPQARSLDDPMLGLNLFVLPPETRVGPQRLTLTLKQKLPWFGKLDRREQAALFEAAAAKSEIEKIRLKAVTEARILLYELAFLDLQESILREEKAHLVRHEEAARARYTAGMGLQQEVIKIQASITRLDQRLLALEVRRQELLTTLASLRDRFGDPPLTVPPLPTPRLLESNSAFDLEALRQQARARRPEFVRVDLNLERSKVLVELAELKRKPDFQVGFGYTLVQGRRDEPGRLQPPPDNSDDILALSGSMNLPIRRGRLEASLREALEHQRLAEVDRHRLEVEVDRAISDLAARLPLLQEQWSLLHNILLAQAEEALSSAEAAYTTGKLGALDLLDAEHTLFEVRTAAARVQADHAIALARLEAAIAGPLVGEMQSHEESPDERSAP